MSMCVFQRRPGLPSHPGLGTYLRNLRRPINRSTEYQNDLSFLSDLYRIVYNHYLLFLSIYQREAYPQFHHQHLVTARELNFVLCSIQDSIGPKRVWVLRRRTKLDFEKQSKRFWKDCSIDDRRCAQFIIAATRSLSSVFEEIFRN